MSITLAIDKLARMAASHIGISLKINGSGELGQKR
jgi:hypothetical protein